MQLFVRGLSGRTQVVEADPLQTVAALKAGRAFGGVPASLLRLTAHGRELDDNCTLLQCGVTTFDTLHASARLRGGVPTHISLVTKRAASKTAVARSRACDARLIAAAETLSPG